MKRSLGVSILVGLFGGLFAVITASDGVFVAFFVFGSVLAVLIVAGIAVKLIS